MGTPFEDGLANHLTIAKPLIPPNHVDLQTHVLCWSDAYLAGFVSSLFEQK